ncbi:hypothetical protein FKM82_019686 [Ascaphus truei]
MAPEKDSHTGTRMKYICIAIISSVSASLLIASFSLVIIGYLNPHGTVGLSILGCGAVIFFGSIVFLCMSCIWVNKKYSGDETDLNEKLIGTSNVDTSLLKPVTNLGQSALHVKTEIPADGHDPRSLHSETLSGNTPVSSSASTGLYKLALDNRYRNKHLATSDSDAFPITPSSSIPPSESKPFLHQKLQLHQQVKDSANYTVGLTKIHQANLHNNGKSDCKLDASCGYVIPTVSHSGENTSSKPTTSEHKQNQSQDHNMNRKGQQFADNPTTVVGFLQNGKSVSDVLYHAKPGEKPQCKDVTSALLCAPQQKGDQHLMMKSLPNVQNKITAGCCINTEHNLHHLPTTAVCVKNGKSPLHEKQHQHRIAVNPKVPHVGHLTTPQQTATSAPQEGKPKVHTKRDQLFEDQYNKTTSIQGCLIPTTDSSMHNKKTSNENKQTFKDITVPAANFQTEKIHTLYQKQDECIQARTAIPLQLLSSNNRRVHFLAGSQCSTPVTSAEDTSTEYFGKKEKAKVITTTKH